MNTRTAWRPPLAVTLLLLSVLLLTSRSAHASRVTGHFTYERPFNNSTIALPISNTLVQIWRSYQDPSGIPTGVIWLQERSVLTDSTGWIDIELPYRDITTSYQVRVYATNAYARVWPIDTLHLSIFDHPWYALVTNQVIPGQNAVYDVSHHFTDNDSVLHFNMARALWFAGQYMAETRGTLPIVNAQLTSQFKTFYQPPENVINVESARALEDFVLSHEYGHFITEQTGSLPWLPAIHRMCEPTGKLPLAWMEGFAHFYARSVAQKYPNDIKSSVQNLEDYHVTNKPDCGLNDKESTEYFSGALLWDLVDPDTNAEYFDWEEDDQNKTNAQLIFSIVHNELDGIGFEPTIWKFRDAWIGRGRSQLNIDRILAHLGVMTHFNHAGFVSMSVPTPMIAGQSYPVQVVMHNNGSTTWSSASDYSLGSQSAQDNTTWDKNRVAVGADALPIKGGSKTFNFTVKAPTKTGTHDFQWQMVQDNVGWFGEMTPLKKVAVTGANQQAQFISQSVPTTMPASRNRTVSVTMKNVGDNTWSAGSYFLGSQNPQDNGTWSTNRVSLPQDIGPGGQVTFTFQIRSPLQGGTYDFQWRMFQDGVGWFGDYTQNISIFVNDATCDPYACADNCIQDGCRSGSCNVNDFCVCTRCDF